jgi:hypothetical protein
MTGQQPMTFMTVIFNRSKETTLQRAKNFTHVLLTQIGAFQESKWSKRIVKSQNFKTSHMVVKRKLKTEQLPTRYKNAEQKCDSNVMTMITSSVTLPSISACPEFHHQSLSSTLKQKNKLMDGSFQDGS